MAIPVFYPRIALVAPSPGGDPTEVDPNVATFAWNASRMSDLTDMAPINGIDDIVLTLRWL